VDDFQALTSAEIRTHRETVLLRLLVRLAQIETAELVRRLEKSGHGEVQRTHITLLANVDTEGTRLVELARRLGTSRQAASQLVKEIVRRGFLERADDPTDGRAVLVRHTAAGRALLLDALAAMRDIEEGYAALVGTDTLAGVRAALRTIADWADADSALGAGRGGALSR
jgi:DNA-binding MarR family transcriptional regulator